MSRFCHQEMFLPPSPAFTKVTLGVVPGYGVPQIAYACLLNCLLLPKSFKTSQHPTVLSSGNSLTWAYQKGNSGLGCTSLPRECGTSGSEQKGWHSEVIELTDMVEFNKNKCMYNGGVWDINLTMVHTETVHCISDKTSMTNGNQQWLMGWLVLDCWAWFMGGNMMAMNHQNELANERWWFYWAIPLSFISKTHMDTWAAVLAMTTIHFANRQHDQSRVWYQLAVGQVLWLTMELRELRWNVFSGLVLQQMAHPKMSMATFLGLYPKLKKLQHLYGWRINGANGYKQCGIGHS